MTDRVALVTGGMGGIGTAICRKLADDGRRVVALDLVPDPDRAAAWQEAERESGREFAVVSADVTDYDSCAAAIAKAAEEAGPIDILVNAAGITRDGTFRKMDVEQWRAVLGTNLDSVFNVTKHVVEGMTERGFGRIVNISSLNGEKGQYGQTNYSAAKAGMHGFTMALAQETAAKGVTVNTVSPGYIATSMVMAIAQEIRDQIVAQIPVGRLGTPEEIAAMVAFLCADEMGFITGSNISINGGQHMH